MAVSTIYRDARRTVTFVKNFLVLDAVRSARLFYYPFDVVVRNIVLLRLCDKITQTAVGFDIRAALPDCNRYFLADFSEDFSSLSVGLLFLCIIFSTCCVLT